MWVHLLAILGLGLLCVAWFILQGWIKRQHPEAPGINRRCNDCTCATDDEAPSEKTCTRKRQSEEKP
jgi:hypothetical protein